MYNITIQKLGNTEAFIDFYFQWMVDHSEMDNSEDQNMSEYINDKHFINKDDLYDLHSGRQVRRRRSSPEPIVGE